MNKVISQKIYINLATSYSLFLQSQTYHWNVKGKSFYALHNLFKDLYDTLNEHNDALAERIRTIGDLVPSNLSSFLEFSAFVSDNAAKSEDEMLADLITNSEMLVKTYLDSITEAKKIDDEASLELLGGHLYQIEKFIWMLKSSS
jgi:starvation-inducible DNA-binding protein